MSPEIVEFFDPAVELRQSASTLGTEGTFHGYDGLLQSAREIIESFQDVRFVPRGIADAGDQVVATVEEPSVEWSGVLLLISLLLGGVIAVAPLVDGSFAGVARS